ncbi:hypothetical protein [Loigolactobacillus rennini]|uniref:hypothetical protein n=1 Tax=Loigolactobacillus rennini TaxID=238013 RepID=UPI00070CAE4D|nr:hypothetical protein [Loigolactobacillus rennini]
MTKFKPQYLYKSHLGSYYLDDAKLTQGELYCDECGKCDRYLGHIGSGQQLANTLLHEMWPRYRVYGEPIPRVIRRLQRWVNRLGIKYQVTDRDIVDYDFLRKLWYQKAEKL